MVCFYHIERGTASIYKLNLDKIFRGSRHSITIKESKVNWTLIEKGNRMQWNWPSPREAVHCISIFLFFKNPKGMLIGSMKWWGKWKEKKGKQRKQEKEEKLWDTVLRYILYWGLHLCVHPLHQILQLTHLFWYSKVLDCDLPNQKKTEIQP